MGERRLIDLAIHPISSSFRQMKAPLPSLSHKKRGHVCLERSFLSFFLFSLALRQVFLAPDVRAHDVLVRRHPCRIRGRASRSKALSSTENLHTSPGAYCSRYTRIRGALAYPDGRDMVDDQSRKSLRQGCLCLFLLGKKREKEPRPGRRRRGDHPGRSRRKAGRLA